MNEYAGDFFIEKKIRKRKEEEKERVPTKHLLWSKVMEEKKVKVKEKKKWWRIHVLPRKWFQ